MECNKDDAVKAAELAEKKYAMQDLAGAKKFCLKALQLYPGLESAKQMLAVVEVHSAAQVKCEAGVEDWYGVLQVEQSADEATIKKQFRKLALTLHPDKNRLTGAEHAFKIVNEAWMVLSDKVKKLAYDSKRKKPGEVNGYYASTASNNSAFNAAYSQTAQQSQHPQAQAQRQTDDMATFWTQCPSCKIQYQYYRKFENFQLLCHRCEAGFIARDIGVPPAESWQPPPSKRQKAANGTATATNGTHDASTSQPVQPRPKDKEGRKREEERKRAEKEREREEKRKLKEALKKAKEEDKRREAMEKQLAKQREREEKEARKRQMEALKKKFKRNKIEEEDDDDDDDDDDDVSDDDKQGEESPGIPPEVYRFGLRRSSRTRKNVIYRDDFDEEDGETRKAAMEQLEIPIEELEQLKVELAERGKMYALSALKVMERNEREKGNDVKPVITPMEVETHTSNNEAMQPEVVKPMNEEKQEVKLKQEKVEEPKPENAAARNDDADSQSEAASEGCAEEESHFIVPDTDFHNFDNDRKSVVEGQVWALYDDAEGMPRFYCEIKVVISVNPFKVRIRWLESYEASVEWEKAGFATTCGQFKCKRRTETEEHFNKFSHLMEVERQGSIFKIFPRTGEVWAVYSNWTSKWLQHDAEEQGGGVKSLRYEMVEIVTSYFEQTGVTVLPLVKVDGFKTIFARGNRDLRTYHPEELLKFSHKVPAHWMTGTEKENAPRDCWELDTAATPVQLIYRER